MKSVLYYECQIIIEENTMKLFRYIAVILLVTCGTAYGSEKKEQEVREQIKSWDEFLGYSN